MFHLIVLTLLISQCYCEVDEYFTVKMEQQLGYKQCQRKCTERRGCTAVDYSSDYLTCTLRLNLSEIRSIQRRHPCMRHYCTEVIVQRRSKSIHVLEVFDDTFKPTVSTEAPNDKLWAFKPVRGETKCLIPGRDENVFEAYPHVDCRLRSLQTFKKNRTYSWLFSVTQNDVRDQGFNIYFSLKKNDHEYGSFCFKDGEYNTYRPHKLLREKVTLSNHARLRLILHNNVLNVTHLDSNVDLSPVKLPENLTDFYAEITMSKRYACKLEISNGKSQV